MCLFCCDMSPTTRSAGSKHEQSSWNRERSWHRGSGMMGEFCDPDAAVEEGKSMKTNKFRWKAADFIAKSILPPNVSSVIQCNLLDPVEEWRKTPESVCKFCKCDLANSTHFRLLPRKVPGKKLSKLITRAQSCSDGYYNGYKRVYFSKYELSLLKKRELQPANIMVKTCLVCRKSKKIPLKQWPRTALVQTNQKKGNDNKKQKINSKITKKNNPRFPNQSMLTPLPSTRFLDIKQAATQQIKTKNNPLLNKKVNANTTTRTIATLKKGNKLANLIAADDASKLAMKKNNQKNNIFALLHGWNGK